jgi:hypothetical protein
VTVTYARWSPEEHPRYPRGHPRGGEWRAKLGGERLKLKAGERRLSERQVMKAAQLIADDVADFYGGPSVRVWFEPEYLATVGVDARMRHQEIASGLLIGQRIMERTKDPELGVEMLRIVAHEAVHGSVSGVTPGPLPGFSHTAEEGSAEILSIWWWQHRGQPFDKRDATRRDGRWTEEGEESLAASVVYRDDVREVMKRAASRVGWDREAIIDEVVGVMRGEHYERIDWRDQTDPDVEPPPGVADDAEDLMHWLITEERQFAARFRPELHPRYRKGHRLGGRFRPKAGGLPSPEIRIPGAHHVLAPPGGLRPSWLREANWTDRIRELRETPLISMAEARAARREVRGTEADIAALEAIPEGTVVEVPVPRSTTALGGRFRRLTYRGTETTASGWQQTYMRADPTRGGGEFEYQRFWSHRELAEHGSWFIHRWRFLGLPPEARERAWAALESMVAGQTVEDDLGRVWVRRPSGLWDTSGGWDEVRGEYRSGEENLTTSELLDEPGIVGRMHGGAKAIAEASEEVMAEYQVEGGRPGPRFREQQERILEAGALVREQALGRLGDRDWERERQALAGERDSSWAQKQHADREKQGVWKDEYARIAGERDYYISPQWVGTEPVGLMWPNQNKLPFEVNREIVEEVKRSDRYLEARAAAEEAHQRHMTTAHAFHDHVAEEARTRRQAYLDTLKEVREFGGIDLGYAPRVRAKSRELMEVVKEWFPSDWLESSNSSEHPPIFPAIQKRRGEYDHQDYAGGLSVSRIRISPSGSKVREDLRGLGTGLHEMGHRVEYTHPGIREAEWAFYDWRTRGRDWEGVVQQQYRLKQLQPGHGYASHELSIPDEFAHPYMGKTYGGSATSSYELLTMVIDDLVTRQRDIEEKDQETFEFVLGLLTLG